MVLHALIPMVLCVGQSIVSIRILFLYMTTCQTDRVLKSFLSLNPLFHAGVYMVDANTGKVIWKNNREDNPKWSHGHNGWTADIWDGSPGMEAVSNMTGHGDRDFLLFSSDGKIIMDQFPPGYTPVEWDGDETRELLCDNGRLIGNFNGKEVIPVEGVAPNPIPDTQLIFYCRFGWRFQV